MALLALNGTVTLLNFPIQFFSILLCHDGPIVEVHGSCSTFCEAKAHIEHARARRRGFIY